MPTLHWIGKDKVINHHMDVPFKVLEHSYGFDDGKKTNKETNSGNKIIHGDNLEALKSLLPEYEGRVKCIYIDPPYNTGKKGWVYNDSSEHPNLNKWINKVVGNEDEDLTRHDKWLCMMYPRIQLMKKLLKEDGIMFISINDVEVGNLRLMCDEIFGVKNFLTQLIWNSEGNTDNQLEIKINHEYILVYFKNIENKDKAIGRVVDPNTREDSNLWKGIADNNINKNNPANPPDIIELPIGFPCTENELIYKAKIFDETFFEITKKERLISEKIKKRYNIENQSGMPIKLDDLIVKDFKLTKPCRIYGGFANRNKLELFIANGLKPIEDNGSPMSFYLNRNAAVRYRKENNKPRNILSVLRNFGTTEKMRTELKNQGINFSYPKPMELIKYLISFGAEGINSIILDSFAGSGTTAHAVLKLNNEDDGNRKFILIQLDEPDENGLLINIAEETTSKRLQSNILNQGLIGSFDFFELGQNLFLEDGMLNEKVGVDKIRQYVYYSESKKPYSESKHKDNKYYLGKHNDTVYYFNYEPDEITTLDHLFLATIKTKAEQYVVYADNCLLTKEFMTKHHIIFKKIPRDISRF
jgi:adenine-specific DNA-methyltransferase